MAIEHTLYLEESYGITSEVADLTPPDIHRAYAAALLIVASPDGLSAKERSYFEAWERACGHRDSLVEEMKDFDPTTADRDATLHVLIGNAEDTSAVVAGAMEVLKRGLIYDAIKVASSDGRYSEAEKTRLRAVASLIGVHADMVTALEGSVAIEQVVRMNRMALLQYPS